MIKIHSLSIFFKYQFGISNCIKTQYTRTISMAKAHGSLCTFLMAKTPSICVTPSAPSVPEAAVPPAVQSALTDSTNVLLWLFFSLENS